ncbi:MAG: hypothetical protein JNL32_13925, partial [Candidatus Kapabacteria bacterium]|nr:hypothetical protein [Candidatus Kapabacteria bacterium]
MKLILPALFIMVLCCSTMHAQRYIRSIRYVKLNVFDTTQGDWFFAGSTVNALHTLTHDYVIDDELLFTEGDEFDIDLIEETERNLRRTGLFSRVTVVAKNSGDDSVDVVVTSQDQWSTTGAVLYGSGGGISNYGARIEEFNLAGTANTVAMQGLYRTENDTRWQGTGSLRLRRFLRTPLNISTAIEANRFRTLQAFSIGKPFWTIETPYSYSLDAVNNFGNTFLYAPGGAPQLLPFTTRTLSVMGAKSAGERDRYFASLLISIEDIQRVAPQFRQALDNSA